MNYENPSGPIDPVLTIAQVRAVVTYSKSQLYRMVKAGEFPPQVKLGPGRVGWRRSAIAGWLANRPDVKPLPHQS